MDIFLVDFENVHTAGPVSVKQVATFFDSFLRKNFKY